MLTKSDRLVGPPRTLLPIPVDSMILSRSHSPFHDSSHSSMQRGRNRPDPVSCRSCRSKKLKCDRVQPCSNCTARGITCNFLVPPQRQAETSSTAQSNAELLQRIERLETMVLRQHASDDFHLTGQPAIAPASGDVGHDIHQKRDEDSQLLENVGTREDALVCDSSLKFVFGPLLLCTSP